MDQTQENLDTSDLNKTLGTIGNNVQDRFKCNDDFSTMTIEECEKRFREHYETNIDHFAETKDKLALLRSCIELLTRLEDSNNNSFAGRVLIFLTKVIPLFDQSGFNLKSEFGNRELPKRVTERLIMINSESEKGKMNLSRLLAHDYEEGETLSDEESNEPAPQEDNDKLFERFWKVQQFLTRPNSLYDKNSWFTFRTHIDALVYKMENKSSDSKVWNLRTSYMTEPFTFGLQFNDVNMRRCFLVQILIVLQYLELSVETRPENYVLDKGQTTWSASITKRIYGILASQPNREEGHKFSGQVKHILRNEELWNRWKNDKCKEPKKVEDDEEMLSMRGTYHKRRKISDELNCAKPFNMHVIGSQEMTRLWNMKPSQKFDTPDLIQYLNIPVQEQDERFKDPNLSFIILRLLRKSPHFFGPTSAAILSLDGYLKAAVSRYTNCKEP